MGQANPFKPIALVVDDEVLERELMVAVLEEESTMGVIQCQSAEEALRVLEKNARARSDDIYRRQSGRQD
jgi:CheY-like chemotaxis protein